MTGCNTMQWGITNINQIRNIIGICVTLILCALEVNTSCYKKRFHPKHGVYNDVPHVKLFYNELTTIAQCERMCRLVLECTGFNMKWVDQHRYLGYCHSIITQNVAVYKADQGSSYYSQYASGNDQSLWHQYSCLHPTLQCTNTIRYALLT